MDYKIVSTRQEKETVTVTVEYTEGGYTETVDVPIFAPATKEDILLGITNRGITISTCLENTTKAETAKSDLDKLIGTSGKIVS